MPVARGTALRGEDGPGARTPALGRHLWPPRSCVPRSSSLRILACAMRPMVGGPGAKQEMAAPAADSVPSGHTGSGGFMACGSWEQDSDSWFPFLLFLKHIEFRIWWSTRPALVQARRMSQVRFPSRSHSAALGSVS